MKRKISNPSRLLLCLVLALSFSGDAVAQLFADLHDFTAIDPTFLTNTDGAGPAAGLVSSGNTLYGTTVGGGTNTP